MPKRLGTTALHHGWVTPVSACSILVMEPSLLGETIIASTVVQVLKAFIYFFIKRLLGGPVPDNNLGMKGGNMMDRLPA